MSADSHVFTPAGLVWTAPAPGAGAAAAPRVRFPFASIEPPPVAPGVAVAAAPPVPGAEAVDLRSLFGRVPEAELAALVRSREVLAWRLEHRHCARCGALLRRHRDPAERAMLCPACGAAFYPRLSPAVIVLVERAGGEEVLLERPVRDPGSFWRLVSGFVEPGESAEEAVAREVFEETGCTVGAPRYLSSQSWPYPGSLMLAFSAPWLAGEPRPDGAEVAQCRFFRRDALPALPPGMSVARRMLEAWRRGPAAGA